MGVFPHQVRSLRLCRQPVDFLVCCAAYRLLFKQTRALRSNSVFKAIALLARLVQRMVRCTNENLPKVCPHKRRDLHFDSGKAIVLCKWLFYMIGYRLFSTICYKLVNYLQILNLNFTLFTTIHGILFFAICFAWLNKKDKCAIMEK